MQLTNTDQMTHVASASGAVAELTDEEKARKDKEDAEQRSKVHGLQVDAASAEKAAASTSISAGVAQAEAAKAEEDAAKTIQKKTKEIERGKKSSATVAPAAPSALPTSLAPLQGGPQLPKVELPIKPPGSK